MPSFPECAQEAYEGPKANAGYKEFIDNIFYKNFFGPLPSNTTHVRIHKVDGSTIIRKINTIPTFLLSKSDSTKAKPKYRLIFNAS